MLWVLCATLLALCARSSVVISPEKKSVLGQDSRHFLGAGSLAAKGNATSETALQQSSAFECGVTSQTHSGSDKYELCPESCPYFAQNREDTQHCTFLCVAAEDCGKWNPNKPIADSLKGTRTCRGPRVNFCTEMNMDGTDSCKVCQTFFEVHKENGGCYFAWWNTLMTIFFLIVAIVLCVVVWVIDMCCRDTINKDVLDETMVWRSRSKILMKPQDSEEGDDAPQKRQVWHWATNLCTTDVAGPGMLLHFRFQVFVIVWALVIAILWTVIACFHNELFVLGTRRFGTPRQNCILVAWGYETQQRLMYTKVLFLAIVYVFTFISTLVFAVFQDRKQQEMDADDKTYKDFALELSGLPPLPADHPLVEKKIQEAVEKQAQKKVVGVSVAWNFTDCQDDVMQLASTRDRLTTVMVDTEAGKRELLVKSGEMARKGQKVHIGTGKHAEEAEIARIKKVQDTASASPRAKWSIEVKDKLKKKVPKGTPIILKELMRISGAKGENADTVNGAYARSDDDFNGRSAWLKEDGSKTWVLLFGKKWYVTSQKVKDEKNKKEPSSYFMCQKEEQDGDEGLYSPTLVEAWDLDGVTVELFKGSFVETPDLNSGVHNWMYSKEQALLGPDPVKEIDAVGLLGGLTSSSTAYVVFKTEHEKEHTYSTLRGIMFDPSEIVGGEKQEIVLKVDKVSCEPAAINWNYFGNDSPSEMFNRFVWNVCTWYLGALAVWFFVFYVPYAVSLYNFNYDNGAELPSYYGLIFTMVVVGGNATMYVICDLVAENVQFRYKDTKQVVYVLMYLFACTVNVLLDMVVTYFTARKVMVGLDFRTYDGRLLADIDSFTEQFETYAMQRSLAENTYAYAFPSTFLIPFLLEPFVTIIVPLQVGRLIVRTHKEITGSCAEAYLAAFDFDLGRYADILLNVFLGILIFYFPGGYTWSLFYGMFFSHIVIYVFDHWRVINVIPNVKIVSNEVDWWSQLMFIPCCGMILSCLVFKMNCEPYAGYCVQDMELIYSTSLAGILHCIVHFMLFYLLVPKLAGTVESRNWDTKFEAIADKDAHGWFSVNPVHCLRSQYIFKDDPYSHYCSVGKEHYLRKNESIGVYFEDEPAATEESFAMEMEDLKQSVSRVLTHGSIH